MAKVKSTKHDIDIFKGTDDACKEYLKTKTHKSGIVTTYVLLDSGETFQIEETESVEQVKDEKKKKTK